jgi:hypothetical protein
MRFLSLIEKNLIYELTYSNLDRQADAVPDKNSVLNDENTRNI